jgi:peptidoglycan/xylan/chitin deacetylase (PgdA/CDA1 family)
LSTTADESLLRSAAEPRVANISIDFESIHYYSKTLGLGHPDRDRDYGRIVDRFLDLFAELGVAATFFIVGDDIRLNKLSPSMLRRMVAAGHELANHTMTHPFNLSHLPRARKEEFQFLVDEAVLFDKVAGELGESITLAVTVKYWSKDLAKICTAMR